MKNRNLSFNFNFNSLIYLLVAQRSMKTNRVSKQVHRKSKALEYPGNYSREIYRITCSLSAIKSDNKMTKLKDDGMIRQSSISLNQHRNLQCFIHSESFWNEVLTMESEVTFITCFAYFDVLLLIDYFCGVV